MAKGAFGWESTLEACVPRGKSRHSEDSSPGEGAAMLGTQAASLLSWRKSPLAETARWKRAYVRLKACVIREVKVLFRHALSGL